MTHNIDWVNTTEPTVDYSASAEADYDAGNSLVEELYQAKFEHQFNLSEGADIGGLVYYSDEIVYDYENFVGWVK